MYRLRKMKGLKIKDIFGRNLLSIILSPEAGKKPVYKGGRAREVQTGGGFEECTQRR